MRHPNFSNHRNTRNKHINNIHSNPYQRRNESISDSFNWYIGIG